jgi:hypothetical protein
LKADSGISTAFATTAADHAIPSQTIVLELNRQQPGRLRRISGEGQCSLLTGLYAVTTKAADSQTEIDLWITADTTVNDLFLATGNAVVTAHTALDKKRLGLRPGWTDGKTFAAQITPEKLGSIDRV